MLPGRLPSLFGTLGLLPLDFLEIHSWRLLVQRGLCVGGEVGCAGCQVLYHHSLGGGSW